MGYVNPDGSINVRIVDGLTWTGIAAPDGAKNIIEAPGGVWVGRAHPCGAEYVTFTSSPTLSMAAPDGSRYVSTGVYQDGTTPVTVVEGTPGGGGGGTFRVLADTTSFRLLGDGTSRRLLAGNEPPEPPGFLLDDLGAILTDGSGNNLLAA